jgi:hypothetical protein
MEQVLYRLHVRFSRAFCCCFTPTSRKVLEALSLFNACLCLGTPPPSHTHIQYSSFLTHACMPYESNCYLSYELIGLLVHLHQHFLHHPGTTNNCLVEAMAASSLPISSHFDVLEINILKTDSSGKVCLYEPNEADSETLRWLKEKTCLTKHTDESTNRYS